jgi:predicted nuclease with TOPRIM domain
MKPTRTDQEHNMTKTKHALNTTAPEWHKGIEVIQDTLRSLEYANDRLKEEIQRKEQFILKQRATIKTLKEQTIREHMPVWDMPQGIPTPMPEEIFYKIGQKFHYLTEDGRVSPDTYIFAQVEACTLNLIGMHSGNRWTDPLIVSDSGKVSRSVFDKHFVGGNACLWVPIP